MKKYIIDLTDDMIRRNKLDSLITRYSHFRPTEKAQFIKHAQNLICASMLNMTGSTMGKIMSEFDFDDVLATREELLEHVTYNGICDEMLRDLVSTALAFVIHDRLDPVQIRSGSTVPYSETK